MLDQVGIAFSEGAPITAELSFLRVSGGKFALGNLIL
jgi:hypothetical protein